jgi:hypothetical protein
MSARSQIFDGLDAYAPDDIRRALGALEPSDDGAIGDLIGAVMSLCRTVEQQAGEIEILRHQLAEVRRG